MSGPWGNEVRQVNRRINLPSGTKACRVTWYSYACHTRDNEWDRLYLNAGHGNYAVWEKPGRGNTQFGPYVGNWGYGNCYRYHGDIPYRCENGYLELSFRSDINQHINDESWGFSNVMVYTSGAGRRCIQYGGSCPFGVLMPVGCGTLRGAVESSCCHK